VVIFFVGRKMGLDRRLCATLGAGGAVCGVSGSIAIAGAVGAKKEDAPIAITMVILWAIVMIFFLPPPMGPTMNSSWTFSIANSGRYPLMFIYAQAGIDDSA
jgi:uncharacterized membrane protein YadS